MIYSTLDIFTEVVSIKEVVTHSYISYRGYPIADFFAPVLSLSSMPHRRKVAVTTKKSDKFWLVAITTRVMSLHNRM